MRCPVCQTTELISRELEENLASLKCANCGGNWIQFAQYYAWLQQQGKNLPEKPPETTYEISETEAAKSCPECQQILSRYKVGRGTGFTLDRCGGCGGIWFDRNEWQVLKSRNLHDDVHTIFTAFWQSEVRKEETRKNLDHMYLMKFGAQDYAEIKRIRAWLDERPRRTELLAYLNDRNPLDI